MAEPVTLFDPNEGAAKGKGWMLPGADAAAGLSAVPFPVNSIDSVDMYAKCFEAIYKDANAFGIDSFAKSLNVPPGMMTFGRISYMPEAYNSGVLQWPGIAPEAIRKIVRENLAPQLIIGQRVDDVLRYSTLSTHPWRPGWQIEHVDTSEAPSKEHQKDIRDAESFVMNSNIEYGVGDARKRDASKYMNFQGYLATITRDTLTFDGIATWTDMDDKGKVKGYAPLPASQIRLVGPEGFEGNKDIFAVAVDEQNKVIHKFTRDELVFYVRNRRSQIDGLGYGYSEIEIAIRLIQGFQNAIDLNIDTFNRSAIPNGILVLSGGTVTQKQLDLLNRMWTNLKKGITKAWALPVIGLNDEKGKLELLDLSKVKGMEVYYQDFMNMLMGAFCCVYRFPVRRIGYRISGAGKDNEPLPDSATRLVDDDDPGLAPLLIHIENIINEYLIWSRWPHLRFRFNGKSPKEDAREVEAKKLARTWGEERAEAGLESLENIAKDSELKDLAKILSLCPVDPAKQGVFQTLAGVTMQPEAEEGEGEVGTPGARMSPKKDPATSQGHGHLSGVRRNSRNEKKK